MIHTSISQRGEIFGRDTEQCNLRTIWQKLHSVLIGVCICWHKLPNKILARKAENLSSSLLKKKATKNGFGVFFFHGGGGSRPPAAPWSLGYCLQQLTQSNVYQSSSEHMIGHCDSWKMSSSLQSTGKFPCRLPTFQRGRGFPGGLVSG